ncbi:MAG: hypothetical protein HYX39_08965 [Bacteroidetes bacterium]|nr:hypothetical protein [Bacteroidota bacterium]
MKSKKWLLLLIIAIPSFLWVLLETSTINSYKLHYYGPKKTLPNNDTLYYKVPDNCYSVISSYNPDFSLFKIDSVHYPLFAIAFIKENYRKDSYRVAGLWEYLNYKKEKIGHIPIFLITETKNNVAVIQKDLEKFSDNHNVNFLTLEHLAFDSINRLYFKNKPIHIDYSFFVLIDGNRNIRGYYDGRYTAEIKRLIDEYKHLRLKDEKQKLINQNEIKNNS